MMTIRTRLGILAFFAVALAGAGPAGSQPKPAPADTVISAPAWQVGSTWYYSDGYAVKVSASDGGVTTFDRMDAPGQWFSRQGFLRKDLISGTATRNSIYRTMPNQSGDTLSAKTPLTFEREYLSNGQLMVHASSWTVEGRETITVPAGTFDCWIIVWRSRSLRSDWTGFERWWYSPQTQNYVRLEYKYGASDSGSRVLMRYSLGQQQATGAISAPVVEAINLPAIEPITTDAPAPLLPPAAPLPAARRPTTTKTVTLAPPAPPSLPAAPKLPDVKAEDSPQPNAGPGTWRVQLASSKDEKALKVSFEKLKSGDRFNDLPNGIVAAQVAGRGTFYRAWVGAFALQKEAAALCGKLKNAGGNCTVIRTGADADDRQLAAGEQQLQPRR